MDNNRSGIPTGDPRAETAAPSWTPGPWIVFVDRGSDSMIFTVMPAGRAGEIASNIENGYDARLIAAAPELLAACKRIAMCSSMYPQLPVDWEAVEAAIAKAEDRT